MTKSIHDHELAFPTIKGLQPYEEIIKKLTKTINDVKQSEDCNMVIAKIAIKSYLQSLDEYHKKMLEDFAELSKARSSDPKKVLMNVIEDIMESDNNTTSH